MEKNQTLLTSELYESIIGNVTKRIVELKKQQGITINNITLKKEVLKELKKELKSLKKEIKSNRITLFSEQRNLRKINRDISVNNNRIIELNDNFAKEENAIIDLNQFYGDATSKKR